MRLAMDFNRKDRAEAPSDITPFDYEPGTKYGLDDYAVGGRFYDENVAPPKSSANRVKTPSGIDPVDYDPATKYGRDAYQADGSLDDGRVRAPRDIVVFNYEPATEYGRADYAVGGQFYEESVAPLKPYADRVKTPSGIRPVRYAPRTKYGRADYRPDGSFVNESEPSLPPLNINDFDRPIASDSHADPDVWVQGSIIVFCILSLWGGALAAILSAMDPSAPGNLARGLAACLKFAAPLVLGITGLGSLATVVWGAIDRDRAKISYGVGGLVVFFIAYSIRAFG
ncbi:MAG: hypothetical protein HUK22_04035 [Thermoguttaceae bacterium]|nr:hypothetical protein [Thermoguttaceae bacterium]